MGGVFNDGLLIPSFLIFHAVANALFLTMVMILKRFGVDEVFDKASKARLANFSAHFMSDTKKQNFDIVICGAGSWRCCISKYLC